MIQHTVSLNPFECFNRYMVECECMYITFLSSYWSVLIDTWWNVNEFHHTLVNYILDVLIDTWWNVNVSALKKSLGNGTVLIDTWWNVNRI